MTGGTVARTAMSFDWLFGTILGGLIGYFSALAQWRRELKLSKLERAHAVGTQLIEACTDLFMAGHDWAFNPPGDEPQKLKQIVEYRQAMKQVAILVRELRVLVDVYANALRPEFKLLWRKVEHLDDFASQLAGESSFTAERRSAFHSQLDIEYREVTGISEQFLLAVGALMRQTKNGSFRQKVRSLFRN